MIKRRLALIGAAALLSCSANADHFAPAEAASAAAPPSPDSADAVGSTGAPPSAAAGEGVLDISAQPTRTPYLGVIHFVVKDLAGRVVAGGDDEALSPRASGVRNMSLTLPAGRDYSLSLSATTADEPPTTCNASVTRFGVEAKASASLRVFVWQCVAASSPALEANDSECYWLADWVGVSRTAAPVGQSIGVSTFGHDYRGHAASFRWSTSSPEQGGFVSPTSAQTSFVCKAAGRSIPLSVTIDDGECTKQFTQTVACL